jgi:hypothetical protein
MNEKHDDATGRGIDRRSLLRATGVGAAAAGAISLTDFTSAQATPQNVGRPAPVGTPAGDLPEGADNFYTSDRVTVRKVRFRNQYQMTVVGNLFTPGASTAAPPIRRSSSGTRWAR